MREPDHGVSSEMTDRHIAPRHILELTLEVILEHAQDKDHAMNL